MVGVLAGGEGGEVVGLELWDGIGGKRRGRGMWLRLGSLGVWGLWALGRMWAGGEGMGGGVGVRGGEDLRGGVGKGKGKDRQFLQGGEWEGRRSCTNSYLCGCLKGKIRSLYG